MSKNDLRKELLTIRDSMSEVEVTMNSKLICDQLKKIGNFRHVMLYLAIGNECQLDEYLHYLLSKGVSVYVPVCVDRGIMEASLLLDIENDLEIGMFDILAPKKECRRFVTPDLLDAVIVPGVGFDRNGGRLGFGGGFYDRYLPRTRKDCKKIAVCFEKQLRDDISPEEHDFPMDGIITEKACYILEDLK